MPFLTDHATLICYPGHEAPVNSDRHRIEIAYPPFDAAASPRPNKRTLGQDLGPASRRRGRRDAAEIGGWIGHHPPFPNRVLVSPAVRAHQTWEIAREAMASLAPRPEVDFLPELYGADPAQLLRTIRLASVSDPRALLLVGHNPGMHELALTLTGSGDAAAKRRRTPTSRRRGLRSSISQPTTGMMWRSAAASSCCSSAQNC
jgi:phosphohistidine phosphatase SixA